ncbi:hypothetical protein [Anthocerotibacter panamensis]|uniref:hypothetical protein n=1 Tax=Anthocerotibacter panamensis TaxID=2857077 RepID=UPI001C403E18|nr:hypothetical protein [Anthocerotibacter panamensis]
MALVQEYSGPAVCTTRLQRLFLHLDLGMDPVQVMQEDQLPIVSHGEVNLEDLEVFCQRFAHGLGYCPYSLS